MKLVVLSAAVFIAGQLPELDTVLSRLDAYLADYEPKLSELIADEAMQQDVRRTVRGIDVVRLRRDLASEVAFIALPNDVAWLGFRHIKTVDKEPVGLSNESLAMSLKSQGLETAHLLVQASAAHNLGLPRTTNLPNLPLEFLHRRNRARMLPRIDGRERIRATDTVRVVFLERMTPTLIKNPRTDADMPSVVRAWIDPANGRLLRAEVNTFASPQAKRFESSLRVEFVEDQAVGIFVPSEMREEFPAEQAATGRSVARYSNYRRFQTGARIVK